MEFLHGVFKTGLDIRRVKVHRIIVKLARLLDIFTYI